MAEILMQKVYWVFGRNTYGSYDDFIKEVDDYNNKLSSKHEWAHNKIAINHCNKIKLIYCAMWKSENNILEVVIEGKYKSFITMGEILFKLNNESINFFQETNNIFFGGISKSETTEPIPVYNLWIGS